MATNPMKRRERNSFLIGFIIALVFMAVIVLILVKQYSEKKDELNELKALQKTVIVAANDIESGATLKESDFTISTVMTDLDIDNYYTSVDDMFYQESDDSDDIYELDLSAKLGIPAGTIITPEMIVESGNEVTDDMRIQEYSSIVLPSQLKNGDFIDIRLTLPTGQDYIVLSKKEVIQTDATTVWFKVNEAEILLLNSAMVEAWTITGTKLYAVEYVDAGTQVSAKVTYQPAAEVADLINSDPNVVSQAYTSLASDLNASRVDGGKKMSEYREYIDSALSEHIEERESAVESGFSEEITSIQTHREEYVESLEGTGLIGNDEISN